MRTSAETCCTSTFDPAILDGWGVRPSDWHLAASIEQQIGSRSSLSVTYTRRWFRGFSAVDNLALAPADLTSFSLLAPLDPRLPGGGGYSVSGLYDVVPEKAGQVDNFVAAAGKYGAWTQDFTGVDVTFNVRAGSGPHPGRGNEHRPDGRRQLRCAGAPCLSYQPRRWGQSAFGAGLANSTVGDSETPTATWPMESSPNCAGTPRI